MVALGTNHDVATVAQLTSMNQPLGRAVGNAIEVDESVEVLRGAGPRDVRELTIALARTMLDLVGITDDPAARLDDGSAYEVYHRMISAQGGDPDAVLEVAHHKDVVLASRNVSWSQLTRLVSASRRGVSEPVELAKKIP